MTKAQRTALVRSYLGKTVHTVIDRPIGYIHQKEKYTLTYPINYGYIPGVLGGDGEELDVYVLGIEYPVTECDVRVIGIAFREDDIEDKLIAAPEGMQFDQAQIAREIAFQEQYYHTTVEALFQRSCGVILRREDKYLLLYQRRSHTWSFPKGHVEPGETELQTAMREVWEETGYRVTPQTDFRVTVSYPMAHGKQKEVVLFRADVSGEVQACADEVESFRWVTKQEAASLLGTAYADVLARL